MSLKTKEFLNYIIGEDGSIFSKQLNRYLSPYSNGLGYQAIKLRKNGKRKHFYVHRLVAECFLGNITDKDINHKDCNKQNNNVSNLEIVTKKQNSQHAFENKLLKGFVSKHYK